MKSIGTARLCVEDTLAPYQLKITKVNEKGKTLEGAEFTLYEDAEGTKVVSKIVTDNTGVVTTNPLEVEKKYYIKETKAPQGYRIPKDAMSNDVGAKGLAWAKIDENGEVTGGISKFITPEIKKQLQENYDAKNNCAMFFIADE